MNSITFFDFLGKKIYSVTTKEPVISIKDGKSLPPGKYVAKIKPLD